MSRRRRRSPLWLLLAAVVVSAIGAVAAAAPRDDLRAPRLAATAAATGGGAATGTVAAPCGAATAATIAAVDRTVAERIYAGELRSTAVSADAGHVTHSAALLSALAASDGPATYAAVHALVYAPHWHIVRLRVLQAGRVLADVGGPHIIAPVTGVLRRHGRVLGSYVMSVQDDTGYVKLVSRFIGVPIDLYGPSGFLMGTLQPAPAEGSGTATAGGHAYLPVDFGALAFPSGSLQVELFVPAPATALAAESCDSVRTAAWGSVAQHVAARFRPLAAHYQDLADVLRSLTGGVTLVRAEAHDLVGGSSPARLPAGGTVRFAGRSWSVFSWAPSTRARVYLLTPGA